MISVITPGIYGVNGKSTYLLGKQYQKKVDGTNTTTMKYYSSGSTQIAVRTITDTSDTLQWMLSDHLGSTSTTANADGSWNSSISYSAFGEIRASSGITASDFRYTGQLRQAELGLYYYVARWYDPQTAHFTQADTVVPNAGDAASYDRYTYVRNNPVRYIDPTGHIVCNSCSGNYDMAQKHSPTFVYSPVILPRSSWEAHNPGSYGKQTGKDNEIEGLYPGYQNGYKKVENPKNYIRAVIHHEGDDATQGTGRERVKQIQESQMNSGYYDIGYHYIIDPDGIIYEGRDINFRGNAAIKNSENISILWLGDFNPGYEKNDPYGRYGQIDPTDDHPTEAQYQATVDLISWLDYKYGLDEIAGHREVPGNSTVCPGDYAMPFVERMRSELSGILGN
jgi:RHS repeat-associated protein